MTNHVQINASHLTIGYDKFILLNDISFTVDQHDIFIIMGASGGGKTSLLRALTGLVQPINGKIFINDVDFVHAPPEQKLEIMQKCGILYQSGALFSSMTLAENIALPLQQYTDYSEKTITVSAASRCLPCRNFPWLRLWRNYCYLRLLLWH